MVGGIQGVGILQGIVQPGEGIRKGDIGYRCTGTRVVAWIEMESVAAGCRWPMLRQVEVCGMLHDCDCEWCHLVP